MRVQDIKTGDIYEVDASYGARLIEQGKAVLASARGAKTGVKAGKSIKGEAK